MAFLVTARKYRPSTFHEVVAQQHVIRTLLNAVRLNKVAHAYLFSGPRGVGKTTTARIFAKALNCTHSVDGEPCNVCPTCVEITEGRCIDIVEIDGASNNGVDDARAIRDAVKYTPSREKYKMYIIDEVHMLTRPAFNALLKTLEEPPSHAIFILATTEAHRLPLTIISRCQQFEFRRITLDDIVAQLRGICVKEGLAADDDALFTIAKKADGSMRDAESIFDQVVAFAGDTLSLDIVRDVLHLVDTELFFRVTDIITAHDAKGGLLLVDEVIRKGHDLQEFLMGLEEHFRNLLVARTTGEASLIEAPEDVRARYVAAAQAFTDGDVLRLLRLNAEALQSMRYSAMPRVKIETALLAMTKLDSTVSISDLLSRLGNEPAEGGGPEIPQGGMTTAAVQSPAPGYTAQEASHAAAHLTTSVPSQPRTESSARMPLAPPAALAASPIVSPRPDPTAPKHAAAASGTATRPPIVQMLIDTIGAEIIRPK